MQYDLLLKLLAAHFLSDFLLQPASWVQDRNRDHYMAWPLYLHGMVTMLTIMFVVGFSFWWVGLIIGITHILFDGAKSYAPPSTFYFLADQLLHLIILAGLWLLIAHPAIDLSGWQGLYHHPMLWLYICAILFLTTPAGFLIGLLTTRWREQLADLKADTPSLGKAGMIIGIIERLLIFLLVIIGKFEAVGLLIAAKTLLRFNEKDRPEVKTEYLLVGTLISVALAIGTGFLVLNIHFN
jgi:hypothetical protein